MLHNLSTGTEVVCHVYAHWRKHAVRSAETSSSTGPDCPKSNAATIATESNDQPASARIVAGRMLATPLLQRP